MRAEYGEMAIADNELFNTIVQHRKTVTPLRGMDYSNHAKEKLRIIPPDSVMDKWEADYKTMQENMIIGESLKWEDLLDMTREIEDKINSILY
nr:hypothetical protein [Sphingobacterium sp. CFCC 11742]